MFCRRGFYVAGQLGGALHKAGYNVWDCHKCAITHPMGQRSALIEQLEAARRHAGETEANIKAQLDTFVSGMVVGGAMTKAQDVLRTLELVLQNHLADIEHIRNDLHKLPPVEDDAQS
jgi:hypothetical protein